MFIVVKLVQLEVMRLFDSPPVPAPGLGGVARSEWWDTFSFHGIVRLLSESVPPLPPPVDADRLPAIKIVLAARLRKELRDDLSYDRTASIEDACGRYAGFMTRVGRGFVENGYQRPPRRTKRMITKSTTAPMVASRISRRRPVPSRKPSFGKSQLAIKAPMMPMATLPRSRRRCSKH